MRKLNQKGSFLIWFTLSFALLATFIGFALDFGRAYLQKARIARLVDGASIAAAKALKGQAAFQNDATRAACDSMTMNGAPVVMTSATTCAATQGAPMTALVTYFDAPVPGGADIKHVRVEGTEPVPTTFLRFLGWMVPGDYSKITVKAAAEAAPERPIDLMLVLDRSGSMQATDGSGNPKITSLKIATNAFLDQNFTVDDHLGMTSFAYRGCGGGTPSGDANTNGDCSPDNPLGTSQISDIKTKVNNLVSANGTTVTMEGLKVANTQITNAINDPTRSATRKAVLLITDGRPTSSRRTGAACNTDPIDGTPLGISSPPSDCIHSVFVNGYTQMYWNPIDAANFTGTNQVAGANFYLHNVQYARQTAVDEANAIRNLASKGVPIYVIAIGRIDSFVGNSLDDNAKCLLARIANDPNSVVTHCPNVFTTADGDSYPDLLPCKSNPTSCIDNTQQKGRMFTIDLNGNVQQQLEAVFKEVAVLLKLRITV